MPVYNGERLLPRALDSLLAQDVDGLELVVSDNASTDATEEICREYAASDPRIRYYRNDHNVGLVRNFNRVFELSRAEYFKWASHDDWIDPRFVATCLAVLEADRDAVLCTPSVVIVDESGRPMGSWQPTTDLCSSSPRHRLHRLLWSLGEPHAIYGLIRAPNLRRTRGLQAYLAADRVLLAELILQGPFWQLQESLHHYTVDLGARAARTYSIFNDPRNLGRLPLRTWRLWYEHLRLVAGSPLTSSEKAILAADVSVRFGARDSRRLLAELYHSARIVGVRAVAGVVRATHQQTSILVERPTNGHDREGSMRRAAGERS
jgi:glycosyltransferase involved in cell wall biosynthesis